MMPANKNQVKIYMRRSVIARMKARARKYGTPNISALIETLVLNWLSQVIISTSNKE